MNTLAAYLDDVAQTLAQLSQEALAAVAEALWATYEQDGTIFVCGNGGSAATASHFACDLSKWTIQPNTRRMRAIALTDNIALMTAWSNDQEYSDIFMEQLIALHRPGDLVVAISGSGNSPNVLRAIRWANGAGMTTVGLSGFDGGELAQIAQVSLHVNNHFMPQIEDAHSTVCHALAVHLGRRIARSGSLAMMAPVRASQLVEVERALGQ